MRIYAKVTPRAPKNEVLEMAENDFKIKVTAAPEKGKANEAVIDALSEYFHVAKSSINIVGGKSARTKIIDIHI